MEKNPTVTKGMYLVGLGVAMFCCGAIFGGFLTEYKNRACHQVDVYVISDSDENGNTAAASASVVGREDVQTASTASESIILNILNYDTDDEYLDKKTTESSSSLTESATHANNGDSYYYVDESVESPRTDIWADYHFDDEEIKNNGSQKYFISGPDDKLNWFAALQACAKRNLELVGIESSRKNTEIVDAIRMTIDSEPRVVGKVDDFWTSGTNLWGSETKEFYWANSGLKIQNWTNWHVGMPNHPQGQHCVEITKDIDSSTSGQYMWNDYGCHILARYICEKSVISNQ